MKYAVIIIALLISACTTENSPSSSLNSGTPQFIGAVHKECVNLRKTADESGLVDYYYNKDTLCLVINFSANCCPGFVDSSMVSPGSIKLFVRDTLANCRCICEYTDEFNFIYSYDGETTLEFWQAGLSGVYGLGFESTF